MKAKSVGVKMKCMLTTNFTCNSLVFGNTLLVSAYTWLKA